LYVVSAWESGWSLQRCVLDIKQFDLLFVALFVFTNTNASSGRPITTQTRAQNKSEPNSESV
jgi:hypothetical protein